MSTNLSQPSSDDLLIIGAGQLGILIGLQWRTLHPSAKIYAGTFTDSNHSTLISHGFIPFTCPTPTTFSPSLPKPFTQAVFCVPASMTISSHIYAQQVEHACTYTNRLVFTSSTSVYGIPIATPLSEISQTDPTSRLHLAEQVVLNHSSTSAVVRLTGLYSRFRGPSTWAIRYASTVGNPQDHVNLIHYDDAASLVVKVLKVQLNEGNVFMGAGNKADSKLDLVQAVFQHPLFGKDLQMPQMNENAERKQGRILNSEWTRKMLLWKPKFESYSEFAQWDARMIHTGDDVASIK